MKENDVFDIREDKKSYSFDFDTKSIANLKYKSRKIFEEDRRPTNAEEMRTVGILFDINSDGLVNSIDQKIMNSDINTNNYRKERLEKSPQRLYYSYPNGGGDTSDLFEEKNILDTVTSFIGDLFKD